MVTGYHGGRIYIGEGLSCQRDKDNGHDPCAVAVIK